LFKSFLQSTSSNVVSGDKMMNKACGPVWHPKQKAHGIIPEGVHGLDQEATWGKSYSDGWVYGHGSFCLVSHTPCVLGAFKYMRNSAHEAKRLWWETGQLRGMVTTVIMDGKADDQALCAEFQRQRQMTLLTTPRKNSDHTEARRQMIHILNRPKNRKLRQQRGRGWVTYADDGGTVSAIIDAPCGGDTRVEDINLDGLMAVVCRDPWGELPDVSYAYDGATWRELAVPGAWQTTVARVNNAGQFVGSYIAAEGGLHGFIARPAAVANVAAR
jgi:hypothetical protein